MRIFKRKKMDLQGGKSQPAEKTMANQRVSARDRKLALLQDVLQIFHRKRKTLKP